ncbi:MAG TPA: helix-turn-helix transcriptional regulator [Caldimonas sp.]|nr:helix-turn-helix transcriptional regulator [Caldimonas sp.]
MERGNRPLPLIRSTRRWPVAGERDPPALLALCDVQIRRARADLVKETLRGTWRVEHVFALEQALQNSVKKGAQDAESASGTREAAIEEGQESGMTMKTARKVNPHIGSDCDGFLREEGAYDQAISVKRLLAYELQRCMQKAQLTKTDMAKRMGTTRAQLDRLLNPENPATTLQTLVRVAGRLEGG